MLNYRQHLAAGIFTAALLATPLAVHAQDVPANSTDGQTDMQSNDGANDQGDMRSNQRDESDAAANGQTDGSDKHSQDD
jgi:hypothetical protein